MGSMRSVVGQPDRQSRLGSKNEEKNEETGGRGILQGGIYCRFDFWNGWDEAEQVIGGQLVWVWARVGVVVFPTSSYTAAVGRDF